MIERWSRARRAVATDLARRAALLIAAVVVSGCTSGPDFQRPDSDVPASFAELGAESRASSRRSLPREAAADLTEWWSQFGDPVLSDLITRAVKSNLGLAQAAARIRQARASLGLAAGELLPTVNASASADRSYSAATVGGRTVGSTRSSFREGFDASWEIDIFGGLSREVEAAEAQLESARFDRASVLVSLCAEVAATYTDLRGTQQQLAIARRNLEAQQQTLVLTQERFEVGFVSALDVANARAQVASTTSTIPSFEAAERADVHALSVLLGQPPSALATELAIVRPIPVPPGDVPVGLPSELLLRRPDIQRAESDLHAATARIGVAMADRFPRFSLTGSVGTQGSEAASLVSFAHRFWSIGPSVSWPIFEGGRIDANIELQRASAEEVLIAYKASVLTALRDVETALAAFLREQDRRAALSESAAANTQAVDLALQLYGAGKTDFLNVLNAQRQLLGAESSLVQSETQVTADLIALYKSLGGGWRVDQPESRPSGE